MNTINTIVLRAEDDSDIYRSLKSGDYAFGDKKSKFPQYQHNRLIIVGETQSLIAFGPKFEAYDANKTKSWLRHEMNRMWRGLATWDKAIVVTNEQLKLMSDVFRCKSNSKGKDYYPALVQGGIGYCYSAFMDWTRKYIK